MTNNSTKRLALPVGVVMAILGTVLLLVGWIGWSTFKSSTSTSERVPIDVGKLKESMKSGGGFGKH